jgi:electron transport complex protein RnfE
MIDRKTLAEVGRNGLWKQNAALVQALGLCPLLAVSTNAVNGTTLAMATVLVMLVANVAVALLRHTIPHEIRIPVFILIIAALVTVVDLAFNAWLHGLYLVLGIFIPLIVTNCIVLARVEAFAAKNPPLVAAFDGITMGIGLMWTLALLGALRELLGSGTLFGGIELVVDGWQPLRLLPEDYPGLLLAILPPGGFILLGCLIAAKNALDAQAARRRARRPAAPALA